MKEEMFNCKICGGQLEIEDRVDGILKCRNCGNKIFTGQTFSKKEFVPPPTKNITLIEETTTKQLDIKNKKKRLVSSCNTVRTFIFFITLIYIAFLMFIEISSLLGNIELDVKHAMLVIVAAYFMLIYAIIVLKIKTKNYKFNLVFYLMGFIVENFLIAVGYNFLIKNIIDLFV